MREIEFRAWDKKLKVMKYSSIVWGCTEHNYPALTGLTYNDDIEELSDLMQYTGLKDKNGRKIFCGDIVSGGVYYGWKNEKGKGIVQFGEWGQDASGGEYGPANCCGWYLKLLEQQFGDSDNEVSLFQERDKHKFIEIIGNIYEHSHLLDNTDTKPQN